MLAVAKKVKAKLFKESWINVDNTKIEGLIAAMVLSVSKCWKYKDACRLNNLPM